MVSAIHRVEIIQNSLNIQKASWKEKILCEEDIHSLRIAGLSLSQARVYLALTIVGKSSVNTVAKAAEIDPANTHRTMESLEKLALVKKTLSVPNLFEAVPIKDAIEILLKTKAEEYSEIVHSTKTLSDKYDHGSRDNRLLQEKQFLMIPQKNVYMKMSLDHWKNARKTVDVITTVKRAIQSRDLSYATERDCLCRGVAIRTLLILNADEEKNQLSSEPLRSKSTKPYVKPLWQTRFVVGSPEVIGAIFDNETATFIVDPSADYMASPSLLTNHRGFIAMFKSYFDKLWDSSEEAVMHSR